MRKSRLICELNILEDELRGHMNKTERETEALEERIKVLECDHSITEVVRKWAGMAYFVEVCKICGKNLKSLTDEEFHKAKYESLTKQAAEHKKYLEKSRKGGKKCQE